MEESPIPKIIHAIWIGSFPEPKKWLDTWKPFCEKYNWTFKLWREKDIDEFGLKNRYEYDTSVSYQQKSDIVRYEIMYKYGGMYIDCDMVWLGSDISKFIPLNCKMFIGVTESPSPSINKTIGAPFVANGFFCCPPNCVVLKRCIDLIKSRVMMNTHHTFIKTGPTLINLCIKEPIILLPTEYIFPLDFHYQQNVSDPTVFKDRAFIFTYNGQDYDFMKKLKNLKATGKCDGDDCSMHFDKK